MVYLIVILITVLVSALAGGAPFLPHLRAAAVGAASVIAWDGLCALVIRRCLPEKWFAPTSRFFSVSRRETRFYRRLRINRWKRYVPELGGFTSFHKSTLVSTTDKTYLARFLTESNYGMLIHAVNALFPYPILLFPCVRPASVFFPVAGVNFLLSILPLMILRSNIRGLRALYARKGKVSTNG